MAKKRIIFLIFLFLINVCLFGKGTEQKSKPAKKLQRKFKKLRKELKENSFYFPSEVRAEIQHGLYMLEPINCSFLKPSVQSFFIGFVDSEYRSEIDGFCFVKKGKEFLIFSDKFRDSVLPRVWIEKLNQCIDWKNFKKTKSDFEQLAEIIIGRVYLLDDCPYGGDRFSKLVSNGDEFVFIEFFYNASDCFYSPMVLVIKGRKNGITTVFFE